MINPRRKKNICNLVMVIEECEFKVIKRKYPNRKEKILQKFYSHLIWARDEIKTHYLEGEEVEVNRENLASKFLEVLKEVIFEFIGSLEALVALNDKDKTELEDHFLKEEDHTKCTSKMEFPRKQKLAESYFENFQKVLTKDKREKICEFVIIQKWKFDVIKQYTDKYEKKEEIFQKLEKRIKETCRNDFEEEVDCKALLLNFLMCQRKRPSSSYARLKHLSL